MCVHVSLCNTHSFVPNVFKQKVLCRIEKLKKNRFK